MHIGVVYVSMGRNLLEDEHCTSWWRLPGLRLPGLPVHAHEPQCRLGIVARVQRGRPPVVIHNTMYAPHCPFTYL